MQEPCPSDCLGDGTGSCENQEVIDVVRARAAPWLGPEQRGLFATAFIRQGSYVANFGPLSDAVGDKTPYTLLVRHGHRGSEGGAWTRRCRHLAPRSAWQVAGHLGPLVNHTCCPQHRTCEFVVTDTDDCAPMPTVWVRTTKDIEAGAELCADYNESRPHLVPQCLCCRCAGACALV